MRRRVGRVRVQMKCRVVRGARRVRLQTSLSAPKVLKTPKRYMLDLSASGLWEHNLISIREQKTAKRPRVEDTSGAL